MCTNFEPQFCYHLVHFPESHAWLSYCVVIFVLGWWWKVRQFSVYHFFSCYRFSFFCVVPCILIQLSTNTMSFHGDAPLPRGPTLRVRRTRRWSSSVPAEPLCKSHTVPSAGVCLHTKSTYTLTVMFKGTRAGI